MPNLLRDCGSGRESDFVNRRCVKTPDVAAYNVLAANSGQTHFVPNLTATCTFALPAVADGLEFSFVYRGGAADAQNWIIATGSATNFYIGGVTWSAAAANVAVFSDGINDQNMTIVTPSGGTRVNLTCDGLNWFVDGQVMSVTTPAFA